MKKWFNRWLLMWVTVVAIPFWWLMIANSGGGGPAKPVHIGDLRKLAAIIPGQRPTAVTAATLTTLQTVGDMTIAGIGLRRRPLAIITWALPVPGHAPIIIDPGVPPAEAELGKMAGIDPARLYKIKAEASHASLVLYTQGPLGQQGHAAAAMPGYLLGGDAGMVALSSSAAGESSPPPSLVTAQPVAAGVVVIPTSSHAPDTRMIYVALADGREFLFAGSVSTMTENWSLLRLRSHLAAFWGPPQNSDETYAWLRTIRQLSLEAPDLQIVPAHDYLWLTRQLISGGVTDMEFSQAAAAPR